MKLLDLNVLLYAVNRDSPQHKRAKAWLEKLFAGDETIGLPWVVILGFLRITTSRRIFPEPLNIAGATAVVDDWIDHPLVVSVYPGAEHWSILRSLLAESGAAGNLTTDAHLAALAIEHGCELVSTDADFGRFRGLRWTNPLAK